MHSMQKMWPIATDRVAWFVWLCVCLLVTFNFVNPAKTAEPIEMPFGWVTNFGGLAHWKAL